jgi:hypothetical protein
MAKNTKDYDPNQVAFHIGPHLAEGFADGTFITATRNNQSWNTVSGASGEHARARSNDKTGTFELVLMQSSATNEVLSQYLVLDELNGTGKFPCAIDDVIGGTKIGTLQGWVQQPPSVEYGKELGDRTWTIECGDMTYVSAGGIDVEAIDIEPVDFSN